MSGRQLEGVPAGAAFPNDDEPTTEFELRLDESAHVIRVVDDDDFETWFSHPGTLTRMLRVLLVEDVDELRATLRQALELHGGFAVVADAADGASALAAAKTHQPDVVVLDLGLPDLAGAEVVSRLRIAAPSARIIVYTGAVRPDRAGLDVDTFIGKDKGVRYLVTLLAEFETTLPQPPQLGRVRLGPARTDVVRGRSLVAEECLRLGCGDVVEAAMLVVSELVTNALLHGGGSCELAVRMIGSVLRIEVADDAARSPDLLAADKDSESGRGLLIISSLAEAWGVDARSKGKVVWAELISGRLRAAD